MWKEAIVYLTTNDPNTTSRIKTRRTCSMSASTLKVWPHFLQHMSLEASSDLTDPARTTVPAAFRMRARVCECAGKQPARLADHALLPVHCTIPAGPATAHNQGVNTLIHPHTPPLLVFSPCASPVIAMRRPTSTLCGRALRVVADASGRFDTRAHTYS